VEITKPHEVFTRTIRGNANRSRAHVANLFLGKNNLGNWFGCLGVGGNKMIHGFLLRMILDVDALETLECA
jgi:hypothetical protein